MLTNNVDMPTDETFGPLMDQLNPADVLRACRDQLCEVDANVRSSWRLCRMVEALYHPRRYLRIAYVLLSDPATPINRQWPEGQVIYVNAPFRSPLSRRGHRLEIADHEIEVYRFPNDRRLRGLRRFTGRKPAANTWQEWMTETNDAFRIDPDSLRRVLIRYVPEQKWVARLRARGILGSTGKPGKRSIAVRAASPESCLTLAERCAAITKSGHESSAPFHVPTVVGLSQEDGLLALEWIRGKSLLEALAAESADAVMRQMAGLLKWLHARPVPSLDQLSPTDLMERAQAAAEDLSLACPTLCSQINELLRRMHSSARNIESASPVTLHNDFHWNQVRIQEQRITVLDLERMCLGDPLIDVANFTTQIRMLGHRPEHAIDARTADRWCAAFLREWERLCGPCDRSDAFGFYSAVSCLDLARGMMRHLRSGWRDLAGHSLTLAQERLTAPARGVTMA